MSWKEQVDNYYATNWQHLLSVAERVLRKLKRPDLAQSLVTDSYLYVLQKESDVAIEALAVQWMYKTSVWSSSQFQKDWIMPDRIDQEVDISETLEDWEDVFEKEVLHEARMRALESTVKSLLPHEKRLYDLYIMGEFKSSGEKLAKYVGMSRTSCYNMIRDLKRKLREEHDRKVDNRLLDAVRDEHLLDLQRTYDSPEEKAWIQGRRV